MSAFIYEKIEKEKNGKKLCITIQQVTSDLIEPVVQHMVDNFIEREPLSRHTNLQSDPASVESFRTLWRTLLKHGAGIVALLDEGPGTQPKVIGANVTGISKKTETFPKFPGEPFNYVVGAVLQLVDEANIWEKYGVDCYLTAVGLSVDKNFHGLGLGGHIVRARKKVCEKFNLPMTVTVFTAPESQHIAAKDGFDTVLEYPYKDFNFTMSNIFRDLDGKINIMVKQYK